MIFGLFIFLSILLTIVFAVILLKIAEDDSDYSKSKNCEACRSENPHFDSRGVHIPCDSDDSELSFFDNIICDEDDDEGAMYMR